MTKLAVVSPMAIDWPAQHKSRLVSSSNSNFHNSKRIERLKMGSHRFYWGSAADLRLPRAYVCSDRGRWKSSATTGPYAPAYVPSLPGWED